LRYTLGSEVSRLKQFAPDADLFLFCAGQKYIWTPGRISLSLLSGFMGFFMPVGSDWMVLGVVDAETGDILWFDYVDRLGDLRDVNIVNNIFDKIFYRLSRPWRKR
jgi:hypothetical protein